MGAARAEYHLLFHLNSCGIKLNKKRKAISRGREGELDNAMILIAQSACACQQNTVVHSLVGLQIC